MSIGPRAEKFNIVNNEHGLMQKYDFSVLDQKYHFWANFKKSYVDDDDDELFL